MDPTITLTECAAVMLQSVLNGAQTGLAIAKMKPYWGRVVTIGPAIELTPATVSSALDTIYLVDPKQSSNRLSSPILLPGQRFLPPLLLLLSHRSFPKRSCLVAYRLTKNPCLLSFAVNNYGDENATGLLLIIHFMQVNKSSTK